MGSQRLIRSTRGGALAAGLAGALAIAACSGGAGGPTGDAAGGGARARPEDGTAGPLARYAGYESVNYRDPSHWLCRPGDDIGGDLTPEWGLHLIDVSIVMGDIVERIEDQAAAYTG